MLENIKRSPKREYRLADNLRTVKNTRGVESLQLPLTFPGVHK